MAENMARSHAEIAAVTWVEECDFSSLELDRLVPAVLKASAEALKDYPELNARIEGDELVYLDRYDIGIAVPTDDGPRRAGRPRLRHDVARRAGTGGRAPGGSGPHRRAEAGGAPRRHLHDHERRQVRRPPRRRRSINPPQVAILGVHRIAERPVVRDGEVTVRRMGNISVTFDHRVIYGKRAAEFGLAVIRRLEAGS